MENQFVETPTPSLTHTLRPMGIGDLLDRVIYFYRTHFLALIAYTTLLIVPPTLLGILLSLPTLSFLDDPTIFAENPTLAFSSFGLSYGAALLSGLLMTYVITPLFAGGIGVAMESFLLRGQSLGFQELMQGMRDNLRPLIKTGFIAMFFSFALSATMLLPPVGMAVITLFTYAFYLSLFVTVYEHRNGVEALKRGWILIRGSVWRALGYFVLFYIFSMVFGGIIGGILGGVLVVTAPDNFMASTLLQSIAQALSNVLTFPLLFSTTALLYFDLRIRHEGLDVALAAAEAAGEPLDLAALPVSEEPILNDVTWRAVGILSGIYTGVLVLFCGCIFLFAALVGGLSSL